VEQDTRENVVAEPSNHALEQIARFPKEDVSSMEKANASKLVREHTKVERNTRKNTTLEENMENVDATRFLISPTNLNARDVKSQNTLNVTVNSRRRVNSSLSKLLVNSNSLKRT
jgi:hypothetical protein